MVQIKQSSMSRRRVRGGPNSIISKLQSFADSIPALETLSPGDRLLAVTGVSLFGVVSFAYFFLISGIFTSSGGGVLGVGRRADPRLSSELRKTGLSEEALLRRGGGKRISIGPKALDSNENAVALDIIATLNCDALQEELERDWHTVLDGKKLEMENDAKYNTNWGAGGDGGVNEFKADDYAGDLAQEVNGEFGRREDEQSPDRWEGGDTGSGDGNEKLDDFVENRKRRRRLSFDEPPPEDEPYNSGDGNGGDYSPDYSDYSHSEPANQGLKLTGRHLFCLAAEAITLPKSTSENTPDPSTHCDINSMVIRDELLYLWSSARSQMPEDVILKTLRLVTEHKEHLRDNEVHLWYPDNDKGTEGMLNVLNSNYKGAKAYNFDSEPADSSHDDLYRFHDCKYFEYIVWFVMPSIDEHCPNTSL